MRRFLLHQLLLGLVGCGAATSMPEPATLVTVAAGRETPEAGDTDSAVDETALPADASDAEQREHDVRLIIGGAFSVDRLGEQAYRAVVDRARADSDAYVSTLVRLLGSPVDPVALSNLYPETLLELLDGQWGRITQTITLPMLTRKYAEAHYDARGPIQVPTGDSQQAVAQRVRDHADAITTLVGRFRRRVQ